MAKEFQRVDRVAGLLQRELALLIQHEMKDPNIKMVTVSAVKVSRDLSFAKVYVSTLADTDEIAKTVQRLNKAAGFLRTKLSQTVQLRATPQLRFVQDFSITEGGRLSSLIESVTSDLKTDSDPSDEDDNAE